MNTANLQPNQTIANYSSLCKLLDIKQSSGKSKQLTLESLKRYCSYTRDKHKFHIKEVYEVPITKAVRSNSKWITDIEIVLLDYLARTLVDKDKDTVKFVYMSKRELILLIGLCREVFFTDRLEALTVPILDKTQAEIDFFADSSQQINNIVRSLLSNLTARRIVYIRESVYLYRENGKVKEANEVLATKISEVYGKCLSHPKINASSEFIVAAKGLSELYYNMADSMLKDELGLVGVHSRISFSFTNYLEERITKMKQSLEFVRGKRLETNNKMLDFLDKKLHERADSFIFLPFIRHPKTKEVDTTSGERLKEKYRQEYKEFLLNTISIEESHEQL